MFTIEEDSGTYNGPLRRHNGYYAGDFTRTPMCSARELSALTKSSPRPSRPSSGMPTDPWHPCGDKGQSQPWQRPREPCCTGPPVRPPRWCADRHRGLARTEGRSLPIGCSLAAILHSPSPLVLHRQACDWDSARPRLGFFSLAGRACWLGHETRRCCAASRTEAFGRAVPVVAAAALHDLEEHAADGRGVEVRELAVARRGRRARRAPASPRPVGGEVEAGDQVVVVVGRDRQRPQPARRGAARGGDHVVGAERDVLREARCRVAGQRGDVERQPDGPVAERTTWLRTRPVGRRDLLAAAGLQGQHAAVEQHRLVEALPRLREVDVVDPGRAARAAGLLARPRTPAPRRRRRRRRSARKTSVPSGARNAASSCSSAQGTAEHGRRARAPGRGPPRPPGRRTSNPTAARVGAQSRACCSLQTTRAGPWVHSRTGLLRWRPRKVKPSWRSSTSTSPVSSALTSTKSKATGWPTSGSRLRAVRAAGRAAAARPGPPARSATAWPAGRCAPRRSAGRCR